MHRVPLTRSLTARSVNTDSIQSHCTPGMSTSSYIVGHIQTTLTLSVLNQRHVIVCKITDCPIIIKYKVYLIKRKCPFLCKSPVKTANSEKTGIVSHLIEGGSLWLEKALKVIKISPPSHFPEHPPTPGGIISNSFDLSWTDKLLNYLLMSYRTIDLRKLLQTCNISPAIYYSPCWHVWFMEHKKSSVCVYTEFCELCPTPTHTYVSGDTLC